MESDQQEKEDGLTDKHRSSDLQICLAMKILILWDPVYRPIFILLEKKICQYFGTVLQPLF